MKWYVQWLYPGLKIKRWLFLFSIGLMTLVFGATMLMNYQIFGILEEEIFMLAYRMTGNYSYTDDDDWGAQTGETFYCAGGAG